MNSKPTQAELYSRLDKSIAELLEVLGEINEDDAANAENEWSIEDNNGGRIQLHYNPKTKDLTISKGCLNITVRVK